MKHYDMYVVSDRRFFSYQEAVAYAQSFATESGLNVTMYALRIAFTDSITPQNQGCEICESKGICLNSTQNGMCDHFKLIKRPF